MKWIASLEKRFGSMAIPNLTLYLILLQVIGYLLVVAQPGLYEKMFLHGGSAMNNGEWWRLLSFMMVPKTFSPIFIIFSLYILYLMGSALEQAWGAFRFNLFILIGYLLTVIMAFINPGVVISNFYFLGGISLAFATLFPHFELMLFFVLPVKMKWLGWFTFAYFVYTLFAPVNVPGGALVLGNKLAVIAALVNYALFFGRDALLNLNASRRRKAYVARTAKTAAQPRHECAECGVTDKSDPDMHFRYCSTCGKCFCENHINTHRHE